MVYWISPVGTHISGCPVGHSELLVLVISHAVSYGKCISHQHGTGSDNRR
ncbi:uncharacterized protein METZ01_LOCUS188670, partial [marine metagenome]